MIASKLLVRLHIDDALDAFPVHGVCGFWGVVSTGFFAKERFLHDVKPGTSSHYGVLYGVRLTTQCDVCA